MLDSWNNGHFKTLKGSEISFGVDDIFKCDTNCGWKMKTELAKSKWEFAMFRLLLDQKILFLSVDISLQYCSIENSVLKS